jgi:ketosteroid isomerase-like protein
MNNENSKVIDLISVSDLVRQCFSACKLKDRRIIEDLLSDDFTFTSLLRKLIDDRLKALHDKDINALLSNHAPDILSFDVINPLQYVGADTVRERAEKWFSSFQSSIGYEIRDLSITIGETVAFCHYLYHVSGTLIDGGNVEMWVRATVCFSKIDNKWVIMHEHQSVPFDSETGKALLNLKP